MSQTQKACSDKNSDKHFGITRIFKHSIKELTNQKKASQKNASEKFNNTKSSLISQKLETLNKYRGHLNKSLASFECKESDKVNHSRENAVKERTSRLKNTQHEEKHQKNFRKSFSEKRKEPYKTETLKTEDNTTNEKEIQESLCTESAKDIVPVDLGKVSVVQTEDWSFEIKGQAEETTVDKEKEHTPGCQNSEVQTIRDERKQTVKCADTDINGNIIKTEDWSFELKQELSCPDEQVIVDDISEKTSQSEESGKKDKVIDEQTESLNRQTGAKYSTLEDGGINAVGHVNDVGQAVVKNIFSISKTEDWSFELKAEHRKTDFDVIEGDDSLRKKNEATVDTSAALIKSTIADKTEANNLNDDRCANKESVDESKDPLFSKTPSDEGVSQYSTANEVLNSQSNVDSGSENKLETNPENCHENSINNDLAVVNFEADLGNLLSDTPVHSTPKKMKDKSQKWVAQSCTEMNGLDADMEIFRPYADGDKSSEVEKEKKCRKDLSVEYLSQNESPAKKNQPEKQLMFANRKFKHNTPERKNMSNKSVENCFPITKKRSGWVKGIPPRFRNQSKYNSELGSTEYDKNHRFRGKAIQMEQKDREEGAEDGSRLLSLMDLKIKTENIKAMRETSSQSQNNGNFGECWNFPITEDWTNEIVETNVEKVNKMSEEEWANLKNCTEEKAVAGNEKYKLGTKDKIIQLESGLQEASVEYSQENAAKEITESVEKETDKTSATTPELYLPPPPPEFFLNDDNIAEYEVKSDNNFNECVDNCNVIQDVVTDGILNSDKVVRETQQIRNEIIEFSGNLPYLPPIPDEIIDSGDEKSWKEVNLKKGKTVIEGIEETCIFTHENDCKGKSDSEATQFNPEVNESENVASEAEVSDLPIDDIKPQTEISENGSDIGNVSSLKSVGTSYMEIRLDPGKGKTRPGGDCDGLGETKGKTKETMTQVERQLYEQYARYCYELKLMYPDSVHGQQNSPWSPNFPYNYETYERWMQDVQYRQYLWQMYHQQQEQQQYDEQYQMYYYQYCYPYQNYFVTDMAENRKPRTVCHTREKKALKDGHENKLRPNEVGNDLVGLEHNLKGVKNEPTSHENESEKTQRHQNMTGKGLSEYWPERMDQWIENQTPEKSVNTEEKPRSKVDCCKKKLNDESTRFEVIEDESSINDVTESYKTARDSEKLKNNIDSDQDLQQYESLRCREIDSVESKSKSPCRCKPDDIQFVMWRMCKCEQGNLKLEQVLPCNPDDRSVDFGYLSYESLDQNSSTVRRLEDKKAPGFVIQPLCSTPAHESNTVRLTVNSETEKQDLSASKDHPHPPPGFQLGVAAVKNTQNRTNPDVVRSKHISDNDLNASVRSHKPSLLGLIENLNINCNRATPACHRVDSDRRNRNDIQTVTKHSNIEDNRTRVVSKLSLTNLKHSAYKISEAMSVTDNEDVRNALDLALRVVNREIDAMKDNMDLQKANTSDGRKLDDNGNDIGAVNRVPLIDGSHMPCYVDSESASELKCSVENHPNENLKRNDLGCEKRKARKEDKEMHVKGKESALMNIEISKPVSKKISTINQSLATVVTSESIEGYSETSGDENIQFRYQSQSPSEDSEAKMLNRENVNNAKMFYNMYRQVDVGLASSRNKLDKGSVPQDCENQEIDQEGEILENEIMDAGNSDYGKVKRPPIGGVEIVPRPRVPFHTRPLFSEFRPYRGGLPRQPPVLPCYSDFDPAGRGFPILPSPIGWPPPSMMMPTPNPIMRLPFDPRYMYGRSVSWDGPSTTYVDFNSNESRSVCEETGKSEPSLFQALERDVSMKPPVKMESENENRILLETKLPRRTSLSLLNEYDDSGNDSEPDIEPFDIQNLQSANQLRKHTPKKLKKDTDGDDTSVDSMDIRLKENNAKLLEESAKATKLSRGPHKKLKQKALKSFSAPDWQKSSASPTIIESTAKKPVHEHQKRTLSEIIAETSGGNFQSTSSKTMVKDGFEDRMNREFPPLGSDPKKNLPPLPPLPPFPNSPFWAMYTAGSGPSVETKSPDNQFTLANSLAMQKARNQWKRYSLSPGQTGSNVFSPPETDSESNSIRSDWKTNFKLFHNFGVKYIDTHCHLDFLFNREGFKGSFKGYMDKHPETFPELFEGCVAVFCNPASFTPYGGLWLDVAKEPNVWIAMGCHPKMAADFTAAAELGLKKCLRNEKCIALGEIGLDYSGSFQQHEAVQKDVFRRQLKIALDMHKPLVIHCRDAEDDCLEIMKEIVPQKWKIHCHCFTNAYSNAQLWLDAFPNLYIGVTPLVTYRTAKPTHDLARKIPISRLLLETDAPYFIPRCIPKEELPLSNPGLAVTVAKEIAQYQELPVSAVLRQCRLNTKFVYGI